MSDEAKEALNKSAAKVHYFKEDDNARPLFNHLQKGAVEFVPGTGDKMVVGRTNIGLLFHANLDPEPEPGTDP